jgi:hypothetical protein
MITHDYGLIFVHVPKCAGRSICDIFNQRFDHYTAKYYELEFKRFWNKYNKITIVRNPYDRLVSLYVYIKTHRRHVNEGIACNIQDFRQWIKSNVSAFNGNFYDGSAEGQRGTDGDIGSPFWFTSQWQRIIDHAGNNKMDHTFKLEYGMLPVQQFLEDLLQKQITIPHVNASEYDDYRSFYDNETYALVSEFAPIKEDCSRLGYNF